MSRKTIGAKLREDGELYQRFEEREEDYEHRSEALREVIRAGLDKLNEREGDEAPWHRERAVVGWCGTLAPVLLVLTLAFGAASVTTGWVPVIAAQGAAYALLSVLLVGFAALFQLSFAVAQAGLADNFRSAFTAEVRRNVTWFAAGAGV